MRSDRDVKLAEAQGLLLRESLEPTAPEGVQTCRLQLGDEARRPPRIDVEALAHFNQLQ